MLRQPLMFVLVGGAQYLLDATLYGLLLSAGLGIAPANVLARGSAAAGGFVANRYLTFGQRNDTRARFAGSLLRFIVLWLVLTAVSTGLMLAISACCGTELGVQVAGKLLVEAVLAVISFVASKFWVFRT
jgi:putative flippase GtrA